MAPNRFWQEMTTADFDASETENWIAVLPVAAIEQHGPHLPLYTDSCIAEGLISRTMELIPADLPATFLPVQSIGKSNEHESSPGTLSISWNALTSSWIELGECVFRSGVRKLIIITSHGGNVPIIDIVARELRVKFDMLVIGTTWMRFGQPPGLFDERELSFGIHGGDIETSIMLHLRPDLVRKEFLQEFKSQQENFVQEFNYLRAHGPQQFGWKMQDLNTKGSVGDTTKATSEKGSSSLNHMAAEFVKLLQDVHRFDPGRLWKAD